MELEDELDNAAYAALKCFPWLDELEDVRGNIATDLNIAIEPVIRAWMRKLKIR